MPQKSLHSRLLAIALLFSVALSHLYGAWHGVAHFAHQGHDAQRASRSSVEAVDVNLIQVPPDKKHKTRGAVHINNANGYCGGLRSWLKRFRGVATKNIPNYLAWHRVLDREGDELTAKRFLAAALG